MLACACCRNEISPRGHVGHPPYSRISRRLPLPKARTPRKIRKYPRTRCTWEFQRIRIMWTLGSSILTLPVAQMPHLAGNLWQKSHAQQSLGNRQYSPKSSHLRMRLQDGPRHCDWKPCLGSSRQWIFNTSSKRSGSSLSRLLQPNLCSDPKTCFQKLPPRTTDRGVAAPR